MTNKKIADNLRKEIDVYFSTESHIGWKLYQSRIVNHQSGTIFKYDFVSKPNDNCGTCMYPFISINYFNEIRIGFDTICDDLTFSEEEYKSDLIDKIKESLIDSTIPFYKCGFGFSEGSTKENRIFFDVDLKSVGTPYIKYIIEFINKSFYVYHKNYEQLRVYRSVESKLKRLERDIKDQLQSVYIELSYINELLHPNSSIKKGEK